MSARGKLPRQLTLDHEAFCSAPPLCSLVRPPRLSRETEAVRPRTPLRPTKPEVYESEPSSVEFVVTEEDDVKVKVEAEEEFWIEQELRLAVAAISIAPQASRQQAPTPSASSEVAGPSGTAYRTQALCRIPSAQLGPADPPPGRGRPKGSKSRPMVALTYETSAPPERVEAAKARAKMAPKK